MLEPDGTTAGELPLGTSPHPGRGVEEVYDDFRAARTEYALLDEHAHDVRVNVHHTEDCDAAFAEIGARRDQLTARLAELAIELDDLARAAALPQAWRSLPSPTTHLETRP